MNKQKVIIVDDHTLFAEGLKQLLEKSNKFEVIAIFTDGISLTKSIEVHKANILLLDLNLPKKSGVEILEEIKPYYNHLKIICLSMIYDKINLDKIQKLGAHGYFSKEIDSEKLVVNIEQIVKGAEFLTESPASAHKNLQVWTQNYQLTKKEIEILQLIKDGYSSQEISDTLNRSIYTIKTHRKNILKKTGCKNAVELLNLKWV